MVQEHLPGKLEALGSNSSTTKKIDSVLSQIWSPIVPMVTDQFVFSCLFVPSFFLVSYTYQKVVNFIYLFRDFDFGFIN
jgi:hypothetical protein